MNRRSLRTRGTSCTKGGLIRRVVDTLVREVTAFQLAVRSAGGIPGGILLETTPDDVAECVDARDGADRIGERYTSLCDPRLNPRQAVSVVSAWRTQMTDQPGGSLCQA